MLNFIEHFLFNKFVSYFYVADAPQVWHSIHENYIDQRWQKLIAF